MRWRSRGGDHEVTYDARVANGSAAGLREQQPSPEHPLRGEEAWEGEGFIRSGETQKNILRASPRHGRPVNWGARERVIFNGGRTWTNPVWNNQDVRGKHKNQRKKQQDQRN